MLSTYSFPSRTGKGLITTLSIAVLYFCGGLLGLSFCSPGTWFSPLWAPSGVGLAMILLYGFRIAVPGLILGELAIDLHAGHTAWVFPTHMIGAFVESFSGCKTLI